MERVEGVENYQEGYFTSRIRQHIQEYHPDLFWAEEAEETLALLTSKAIESFLQYDQTGIALQESIELALTETLEGIQSPYSVLKDFLIGNQDLLTYLTSRRNVDDQEVVEVLLKENIPLVMALMGVNTSSETSTLTQQEIRQQLLLAARQVLSNQAIS